VASGKSTFEVLFFVLYFFFPTVSIGPHISLVPDRGQDDFLLVLLEEHVFHPIRWVLGWGRLVLVARNAAETELNVSEAPLLHASGWTASKHEGLFAKVLLPLLKPNVCWLDEAAQCRDVMGIQLTKPQQAEPSTSGGHIRRFLDARLCPLAEDDAR
jgi:hypothetical protein